MKYRLLGAAILIGLAVLIIPALLDKPSLGESGKQRPVPTVEEGGAGFRSKIEPVYQGALEQAAESEERRSATDSGRAVLNDRESGGTQKRTIFKPVVDDRSFLAGEAEDTLDLGGGAPPEKTPAQKPAAKKSEAIATPQKKPAPPQMVKKATTPAKPVPKPAEKAPAKSVAKAKPATTGGWVVRVGTFARKQNADSVIKLLRGKGLTPHRSQVQTKVGKATRIWLGPYQAREEANRVSAGLKEITGEKGYVTKAG